MAESIFKIGADGIDTEKIVAEIEERVRQKRAEGVYDDALIARAERNNLKNLKNDDQFLGFYLRCLRDAVFVDISDFEIREKRKRFRKLLVKFKRALWSMLKFYTYRLWSQQNQVNGLLVTAIEGVDEKQDERIRKLEERIAELEGKLAERDAD
jgi:hypothetical protein